VKTTTLSLRKLKGQRPIVAATAYDALTARYAAEAGVDLLLVGDSVGNTLLGFANTIPVTLDMMVHHTQPSHAPGPRRSSWRTCRSLRRISSSSRLLASCQRLMQVAGAEAVKIEGGSGLAGKIGRIVDAGVPVMGHLGLQPQQVQVPWPLPAVWRQAGEAEQLLEDGTRAGTSGRVLLLSRRWSEPNLARTMTETSKCRSSGIGSGPGCDGQILVSTDLLGFVPDAMPSFAHAFAAVGDEMKRGLPPM